MPRKKTVPIPEEKELTEQTGLPADTGGMEAEAAPETGMTDFSPSDDPFSGGDAGVWEEGGGDVPHDDADGGIAPADPEADVTENGAEEPDAGSMGDETDGEAQDGEFPAEDVGASPRMMYLSTVNRKSLTLSTTLYSRNGVKRVSPRTVRQESAMTR